MTNEIKKYKNQGKSIKHIKFNEKLQEEASTTNGAVDARNSDGGRIGFGCRPSQRIAEGWTLLKILNDKIADVFDCGNCDLNDYFKYFRRKHVKK